MAPRQRYALHSGNAVAAGRASACPQSVRGVGSPVDGSPASTALCTTGRGGAATDVRGLDETATIQTQHETMRATDAPPVRSISVPATDRARTRPLWQIGHCAGTASWEVH